MKLERMRIGSFGVLTDLDLKPGPGLTIIAGNNESGKSTLAAFIPALIFGFPDARSNLNRYPSLAWGRRGGWIEFSSRGRRYRAERWYERGGKVAGNLTLFRDGKDITDADAEDRLIDLWGGLSGDAHRNLLTFGLSELEDVGTLDTEKIARLLYTTAAGIDARSLERIRAELHRRKMELYRPRARSRIGDLLEQLESLARERTSESDLAEHRKLRDELRRERRATRRARERLKVVAKERDAIEAAHRARPLLGRIREIEAALEELDVPVDFPTDATARLDHLSGALEEANEEIEEIRAETEEISAKLHNLELTDEDRLLLSRREEIRRLHGEVSAISERLTRRDKLAAKLQHLSSEALDVLHELGDDWGDDYTKLPVVSLPLRERIHDTKRQIDGLQNQVETIQARESELERAKLELSSTQSSDAEDTRAFGEQTAAEMRSLDDLLQLRDTRERLEERIGYVTLLSDTGGARPLSPMPSVLLALLGLMGAVYWAIADHAILAWIIGISGMTAGLVYWLLGRRRFATDPDAGNATDPRSQLPQLQRQFEEVSARCRELSMELFQSPSIPPRDELVERRRELEAMRLKYAKEENSSLARSRIDETLARLQSQRSDIAEQMREIVSRFQVELSGDGFPPETTPRRASLYLDPLDRLCRIRRDIDGIRAEMDEIDRQLQSFVARVCDALDHRGDGIEAPDARDMIISAVGRLESAEGDDQKRKELAERCEDLKKRRRQLIDRRERLASSVDELLTAGGTDDPEIFRKRAKMTVTANELRAERSELKARLEDYPSPVSAGHDYTPSEEELERARDAVQRTEHELDESTERVGNLRARLDMLESAEAPSVRALKMETAKSALTEALREWLELTAAGWLLERAREMGELERTPAVLRRASEMVARVTGGKYLSVSTDPSRATIRLEASDGRGDVSPDQLSRGTLAGVYLAIRLAVLAEMARRSEPLPIIMDDPLVNLDAARLREALECIEEASRDFQILFLTCHRRIPRLLAEKRSVEFIEFDSKA